MIIDKKLLERVLVDLNLTQEQIINEAGFLNRLGNRIKTAASNAGSVIGNAATNVAAAPANAISNVTKAAGNLLQTDKAIINGGALFVKPDGTFVGLKGIDPNSETGQYLTKQYITAGYKPADANDRLKASTQKIEVHSPQQMTGNLKATTTQAMEQLKNLASQLEAQVASKSTISSQEAGGIFKQLNSFIINSIKAAQSAMAPGTVGTPSTATEPEPVVVPQTVPQIPTQQQPPPVINTTSVPVNTVSPQPVIASNIPQTQNRPVNPTQAGFNLGKQNDTPQTAELYAGQIPQPVKPKQPRLAPTPNTNPMDIFTPKKRSIQ